MKFAEAKQKLKELAKGEYYHIRYEETCHTNGNIDRICGVYISDFDWYTSDTWEESLEKMERQINGESEPEYEGKPDG